MDQKKNRGLAGILQMLPAILMTVGVVAVIFSFMVSDTLPGTTPVEAQIISYTTVTQDGTDYYAPVYSFTYQEKEYSFAANTLKKDTAELDAVGTTRTLYIDESGQLYDGGQQTYVRMMGLILITAGGIVMLASALKKKFAG